jgi:hypothetical protein
MTKSHLVRAQHDADQAEPDGVVIHAGTPVAGTFVRLLTRDRERPLDLSAIAVADVGFLIVVRDRVYVHVSTGDDGVWEFVPLDAP